jgi:hypothetical protein
MMFPDVNPQFLSNSLLANGGDFDKTFAYIRDEVVHPAQFMLNLNNTQFLTNVVDATVATATARNYRPYNKVDSDRSVISDTSSEESKSSIKTHFSHESMEKFLQK